MSDLAHNDAAAPLPEPTPPPAVGPDELDLRYCASWPYPWWNYPVRVMWIIIWKTLWKLCWKRLPLLRGLILKAFGARTTLRVNLAGSVWIEMPWDVEFGEYVSIGPRTHLYNLGGVKIGNHTVLSQDVYVCGGTHDFTDPTYPLVRQKVTIGNYVWIAAGAFIAPGVTIGDGAVVGARAVVVKDVEPWTVVAGHPAKFIKKRELKGHPSGAPHVAT